MYFKTFRPSAALEPYIRSYYYYQVEVEDTGNKELRRYPTDGCPKLLINLGDTFLAGNHSNNLKPFSGCRLLGSLTRQMVSMPAGRMAFLAIRFMPGKAACFFNVRGSELTDGSTSLESVWGAYGREFSQRLFDLSDIHEMLIYIENVLLSQLHQRIIDDLEIATALDWIRQTNGQIRIKDLAKYVGLSLRQFERRFTNMVGLYPKRLCRISRFAKTISVCDGDRKYDWVRLALEAGYSDHAHFIRECKYFTGRSPKSYLATRSPLEVAVWSKNSFPRGEKVGAFSSSSIKNPLL